MVTAFHLIFVMEETSNEILRIVVCESKGRAVILSAAVCSAHSFVMLTFLIIYYFSSLREDKSEGLF